MVNTQRSSHREFGPLSFLLARLDPIDEPAGRAPAPPAAQGW